MRVEWSDLALDDLGDIARYIGRDSFHYAREFVERIFEATDRLAFFPESGRIVPEDEDLHTREILVQDYRVMYEVGTDRVLVLAVMHGARNLRNSNNQPWQKR